MVNAIMVNVIMVNIIMVNVIYEQSDINSGRLLMMLWLMLIVHTVKAASCDH
jgi:hypothetical protein